jgi:hypothetical protein
MLKKKRKLSSFSKNIDNIIIKLIFIVVRIITISFFILIIPMYMVELILQPISSVYSFVITILGITIMLSGACFSASRNFKFSLIKSTLINSGKNFLLSALLMMLILSFIFIKKEIFKILLPSFMPKFISLDIINKKKIIIFIMNYFILIPISSLMSIIWYQGFSELTTELLRDWKLGRYSRKK